MLLARVLPFWVIPETAEKPKDARIKSGKYIKPERKTKGSDSGSME